jgi:hypothetical protein
MTFLFKNVYGPKTMFKMALNFFSRLAGALAPARN